MSTIQQPPQYNPYGYGVPQPQTPPSNGLATGGFVTALVGAIVALIPIVGIVSWVICPVGLVLSIVGLTVASKSGGVGRGMGIAGVALAAGGLIICFLYAAAFSSAMSQAGRPSSTPSSSSPFSAAPAPVAPVVPSGPLTSVPSGTYEVGTGVGQVPPGSYVAPAGSSTCYYARLKNTDGGFDSIIDNKGEYGGGQVLLNVKSSDKALEVSGDCVFAKR